MPEYEPHFRLARAFQNVHIDTTMVGTPFMADFAPLRPDVIRQLGDLQDKIVLRTDFPNIPHPYATQLDVLQRFGLGEDWLWAVCWYNGERLLARG